jgi:hypothetical protein
MIEPTDNPFCSSMPARQEREQIDTNFWLNMAPVYKLAMI